jgi:hypothetical protein
MVIVLHPTLYDGWRHFYFVYPAWLLLVLREVNEIRLFMKSLHQPWQAVTRWVSTAVLVLSLGSTFSFMVRNHPHQNLFFSSLIGGIRGADGQFELDYWGPSYKQAIEKVLQQDPRPVITASFHNFPGELNAQTLTADLRSRVRVTPITQGEYFFTNFRDQYLERPPYPEVARVTVDGVEILSVYRMR